MSKTYLVSDRPHVWNDHEIAVEKKLDTIISLLEKLLDGQGKERQQAQEAAR